MPRIYNHTGHVLFCEYCGARDEPGSSHDCDEPMLSAENFADQMTTAAGQTKGKTWEDEGIGLPYKQEGTGSSPVPPTIQQRFSGATPPAEFRTPSFFAVQLTTKRPLCIDLFCGLGGWAEGFLAEGYEVIGFDITRHDYGTGGYPGRLVLQDVTTLDGAQFKNAACIVASPPCHEYSYLSMPWKRAKERAAAIAKNPKKRALLNRLFNTCYRIQHEACLAAGRYIPMIIENVVGAQRWVGRARWHYGSYYLWGDVPALMPFPVCFPVKQPGLAGRLWFDRGAAAFSSGSLNRKAASMLLAKIPFDLARHIARCFYP